MNGVCVRLGTEQKKKRENDIELNCRWWQKYQQHKLQIFIIPSSECICTFGVFAHIKLPSLFWCLRIRMCRLASVTCTFILNDFLRQRRKRFCAFFFVACLLLSFIFCVERICPCCLPINWLKNLFPHLKSDLCTITS